MNRRDKVIKRVFDLLISLVSLLVLLPFIIIFIGFATISTRKFGLYSQKRVGMHGRAFSMFKIRSMESSDELINITTINDPRVTLFGRFIRDFKLDELPQLWNVILGDMSLVGPRPDVSGYADKLLGEDRIILTVRPGITGPATLKFKNEETLLAEHRDPIFYNDHVIWPDKVRINKEYIKNWSLLGDMKYLFKTIIG